MRAELVGDDTVSCAGITAPVPELCRALLKAGHDGGERLLVYHDGELEFVVPTIAGAAGIKAANSAPGESATVLPFAQFAGGKRKRRGDGGGDAARRVKLHVAWISVPCEGPRERRAVCLVWYKQSCEGPSWAFRMLLQPRLRGLLAGAGALCFPSGPT